MSARTGSRGSARNSSQDQRRGAATAPRTVKSQAPSGVRGVGPAERTGKSGVTYCPGGTRPGGAPSRRRPTKPRETKDGLILLPPARLLPGDLPAGEIARHDEQYRDLSIRYN